MYFFANSPGFFYMPTSRKMSKKTVDCQKAPCYPGNDAKIVGWRIFTPAICWKNETRQNLPKFCSQSGNVRELYMQKMPRNGPEFGQKNCPEMVPVLDKKCPEMVKICNQAFWMCFSKSII